MKERAMIQELKENIEKFTPYNEQEEVEKRIQDFIG